MYGGIKQTVTLPKDSGIWITLEALQIENKHICKDGSRKTLWPACFLLSLQLLTAVLYNGGVPNISKPKYLNVHFKTKS